MKKQSWRVIPNTKLGWWSIGLILATPILFLVGSSFGSSLYETVAAGDTILADIAARPALALTILGGVLCGILAFVTGWLSIFQKKEKTILVYISTLLGALLIVFVIGQVISPN
jgi:uncharacterized membrane protein